jgi:hypothetical protein
MREGGVGSCTIGVFLMEVGGVDDAAAAIVVVFAVVEGRCAGRLDVSSSLPLLSSGGGALRLYLGEGPVIAVLLLLLL